jgi:hypothetical protein
MTIDIATKQDLETMKAELIQEIKQMLDNQPKIKKWLKSNEVKEILNCSDSTLQNLRINGTLEYSRVGGTVYYPYDAILKLLESSKVNNKQTFSSN